MIDFPARRVRDGGAAGEVYTYRDTGGVRVEDELAVA
jgi:hypothetical protein